jgi:MOSC domain-containing protein YiiM
MHLMSAHIFQINTSEGGVPKRSEQSVQLAPGSGIESDRQDDQVHHGGPLQDLLIYRLETILELQREGHPLYPGAVGENITVTGLETTDLSPGRVLQLGRTVEIELTEYAPPCHKIERFFLDGYFNRINPRISPDDARIYARVRRGGKLSAGDPVSVIRDRD